MVSSSSERHPAKLVRHNSSFLGTIKNIVTAPLTWFGSPDDEFTSGKRRRPVQQAPTEPMLSSDEETRRSKRMRLHSPPQLVRRTSVIPRASSVVLPSRVNRSTLSPMRHLSISRTMSIDPPTRENSFNFVNDMDISMDTIRDFSPLSPKPSFRMRSSLTPQPQVRSRHISEPPPLNTLVSSHPVFLHPPVPHDPSPAPTLGSLVESVRSTRFPLRQQHAALLFVPDKNNENEDSAPAERALHQLDVYKTPLLPTRMRSSNLPASITATTTPDMFKSRRPSHLILMQDDKDRQMGKRPVVNETKPYAGEGGMKKLLARRKLEEDLEVENDQKDEADRKDKDGQDNQADSMVKETGSMDGDISHYNLPPLPAASLSGNKPSPDWFSTASGSSASTAGSSLRVGRVKTSRNHIQRPSRARFSAVYEDDVDDSMEDDINRRTEREELEEAARKAPLFNISKDFSFANDTSAPPIKPVDLENAKEPPIAVLPFSFAKSTNESVPAPAQHLFGAAKTDSIPKPSTFVSGNTPSELPAPVVLSMPISEPKPTPTLLNRPASASSGSIPNFFASSQFLAKTPALPVPSPVLNFTASPTPTEPAPTLPVKDAENPFWDGEQDSKCPEDKPTQNILPPLEKTVTGTPSGSALAPVLFSSSSVVDVTPTMVLPFSLNEPTEAMPEAPKIGSRTAVEPKQSFTFPVSSKTACLDDAAFESSSGANVPSPIPLSLLGEAPMLLEKPANTVTAFGQVVPPQSSSSPLPFSTESQGPSKAGPKAIFVGDEGTLNPANTRSSAIEAPKPSFAGINDGKLFSFDQASAKRTEQDATRPTPFSFATTSSAPVVEPKPAAEPKPVFSFGQPSGTTPSAAASPPIVFSFSGGESTSADVSTRQSFVFGQHNHNVVAPTERPVTPPRNPDNEFRMEESPTREIQQSNGANKPAVSLGFSFNASASTGTSLFGGQSQNTTSPLPPTPPFSFGGSSPSNPFASKNKADEPKMFGTFGKTSTVSSTSTAFSFGQPTKASEETQRPSTTGSFSFNTTPTSATTSSPFSFGTQNVNPFGQATSGSAPSSPSTFNQPSPFAFGAPVQSTNASFGFGSQPASPAGGANLTLPQSTGSSGFSFGQQAQSPSSPFGAPIPLAPSTSSGGSLFTIGAAPAPVGAAGGPRQIRKLPNRRGGKR